MVLDFGLLNNIFDESSALQIGFSQDKATENFAEGLPAELNIAAMIWAVTVG